MKFFIMLILSILSFSVFAESAAGEVSKFQGIYDNYIVHAVAIAILLMEYAIGTAKWLKSNSTIELIMSLLKNVVK